jgi:hypothetical protein
MVAALYALMSISKLSAQPAEYSALFEALKPGLFTVEVVDRVSNNKNAQGSAFLIDARGTMATNYHVVSEFVHHPERYRLRWRDSTGDTGGLSVVGLDVVHDLALVRRETPDPDDASRAFELATEEPEMGSTVLALGNPFDIGISIVPGTYNGLLENQFRKNIHFTGALNPGMSGGPAVDQDGRVIGINVAGAGNSVSFLVPVSNLRALADEVEDASVEPVGDDSDRLAAMRERAVERIKAHQRRMIDELLAGDWSLESFGPLMIPREVHPWITCSGGGREPEEETPWRESHSNCTLNDRIYLSRSLDTGPLEMIFGWYSSDQLNEFQFANVFEQNRFMPFNRSSDDDVTEFECREQWMRLENLDDVPIKTSYCLRAYLDYPGLYDVLFIGRALMADSEALHLHYTLAGVAQNDALKFHRHMLGALEWK